MKITKCQKICLRMLVLTLIFYLMRHYSPDVLIEWGFDANYPMLATIFGNDQVFMMINGYQIPRSYPLFVLFASMAWVVCMYKIFNFFKTNKITTNESGMTLVEVMVVVGIMGIMSTIAIRSFDKMKYMHRAEARALRVRFNKARLLAVKNNRPVTIGFTAKHYDIWSGNRLVDTKFFPINSGISISSTIGGASIKADATPAPSPITSDDNKCGDHWFPDSTGVIICDGRIQYLNYITSTANKTYEHITTFSPNGLIATGTGIYSLDMGSHSITFTVYPTGLVHEGDEY